MEKEILDYLKTELKAKKMTYEQLGERMGLTWSTIVKIMNGYVRLTVSRLKQIVDILELPTEMTINNTTFRL